jgi:hypothetical protein
MTDPKSFASVRLAKLFLLCACGHEIGIACSVASAPRIRGVPRMPYLGCRTQGGASLCPGLSHYAPLGLGPMVHRHDLQTGHSPVLQKERDQTGHSHIIRAESKRIGVNGGKGTRA